MSDRSNAQIIAEALRALGAFRDGLAGAVVFALEAEGRLSPDVQGDAKLLQNSDPSEVDQALRERIKIAIQTAQDSEGRLLYVIPPGVAGMYADAVMRVLGEKPYPYSTEPWVCPYCGHDDPHSWCAERRDAEQADLSPVPFDPPLSCEEYDAFVEGMQAQGRMQPPTEQEQR